MNWCNKADNVDLGVGAGGLFESSFFVSFINSCQ